MLCNAAAARRAEDSEGQRPWQMRKAERGCDRGIEIRIDRCVGKARQGKARRKVRTEWKSALTWGLGLTSSLPGSPASTSRSHRCSCLHVRPRSQTWWAASLLLLAVGESCDGGESVEGRPSRGRGPDPWWASKQAKISQRCRIDWSTKKLRGSRVWVYDCRANRRREQRWCSVVESEKEGDSSAVVRGAWVL
ncbi:hypothetical protein K456DRAFT_138046 [Colletotrichum gloeosporioides 23]|nr:hypothetical protein K456DRAFT_138046 [Colletotrichum gloeosporioides 23]